MAAIEVKARTALVTGSSRGIGRGIALKLAECGVGRIGVHHLKNREGAEETARLLRERGAEAVVVQADVTRPKDIARMFAEARAGLGTLGVFVANARPDVQEFYQPVFDLAPEHWRAAIDSQATALLLCAREAAAMMEEGRRIVAITYAGIAASNGCGSSSSHSAPRR